MIGPKLNQKNIKQSMDLALTSCYIFWVKERLISNTGCKGSRLPIWKGLFANAGVVGIVKLELSKAWQISVESG